MFCVARHWIGLPIGVLLAALPALANDWPRWRGPSGNAVTEERNLPFRWSTREGIAWRVEVPGEGASSPVVVGDRVFLTTALEDGTRRQLRCLDRRDGDLLWTAEVPDENPELTSALTGHAAATPVTDGRRVVTFFGNAGVVCYSVDGRRLWQRKLGQFETELGLASSPILEGDRLILVCDHDGRRRTSFDSFLIALDIDTGATRWRQERPGLFRSWSTPIVVPGAERPELIVCAQDAVRAYDPRSGAPLWQVEGLTGWVTPSPVWDGSRIFAVSGKDGPTLAIRPGGRGNVTETHVLWQERRGAPYVCSPVVYEGRLYVVNEGGVLSCYEAASGTLLHRRRMPGRYWSSPVAGDGKVYFSSEDGTTRVVRADESATLLSVNPLEEECLASPAIAAGRILIRTRHHLHGIDGARR